MAKQILSFLIGVGISSAWWSLAVNHPDAKHAGVEFVLPAIATFIFVILAGCYLCDHWDT